MTPSETSDATRNDQACAIFARAALFPLSIDWAGKHHSIYPALRILDKIRASSDLPISSLFPRRVMVVPSPDRIQWSGRPDIPKGKAIVEVIPNRLSVRCQECPEGVGNAYIQVQEKSNANDTRHEIILCTNKLLKTQFDPDHLEERTDLPKPTLHAVEEALAHQLSEDGANCVKEVVR